MDYSSYATFYQTMDSMTISMHKPIMLDKFIPLIGLQSQLESGIVALDVGCGSGFHVCTFGRSFIEFLFQNMSLTAAQFPNSLFTGIDVTADAVRMATQKMNETANGTLQNAAFIEMNGQRMPEEWTEKFDWISMFDTCHDQQRPDLVSF
jgi:ubiquinone/menaquinone biosynthesis C-methylase UbiE